MYCNNCGKEMSDNIKFCTHCGVQIVSKHSTEVPVKEKKSNLKPVSILLIIIILLIICLGIYVVRKYHNGGNISDDKQFTALTEVNTEDEIGEKRKGYNIKSSGLNWDDTMAINNNLSEYHKFKDDKYLYCISSGNLYRSKIGENNFECIEENTIKANNINLVGELLYFSDNDGICEYNPKTGKKIVLSTVDPDFMRVYKGYIYYTVETGDRLDSIYRMNIKGKETVCLQENIIEDLTTLTIFEDNIYFVDDENEYINKMSLDGQQREFFLQEEVDNLNPLYIDNGYMYYGKIVGNFRLGSSKSEIYRVKLDGTAAQQVTSVQTDDYIVYNGKVYYEGYKNWDTDSKVSLCSINVDGSNSKMIENMIYNDYSDFYVVGDSLFYTATTDIVSGSTTSFHDKYYCLNMSDDTNSVLNFE